MAPWDPSTLAQLSAPGFNRPLGSGDVVPYWGAGPSPMSSDTAPAAPGPSYNPNPDIPTDQVTTPGSPGFSTLNNLSWLQPFLDAWMQQQQAASIPSGQGNAEAQPLADANPGPSSEDLGVLIGAGDSQSDVPGIAPGVVAPSPANDAPPGQVGDNGGSPGPGSNPGQESDAPSPGEAPGEGPGPGPGDAPGGEGDW